MTIFIKNFILFKLIILKIFDFLKFKIHKRFFGCSEGKIQENESIFFRKFDLKF